MTATQMATPSVHCACARSSGIATPRTVDTCAMHACNAPGHPCGLCSIMLRWYADPNLSAIYCKSCSMGIWCCISGRPARVREHEEGAHRGRHHQQDEDLVPEVVEQQREEALQGHGRELVLPEECSPPRQRQVPGGGRVQAIIGADSERLCQARRPAMLLQSLCILVLQEAPHAQLHGISFCWACNVYFY